MKEKLEEFVLEFLNRIGKTQNLLFKKKKKNYNIKGVDT